MKNLKYILGMIMVLSAFSGCSTDVDDMPPRLNDVKTDFVLPAPARLTNAERDVIQAKKEVYHEIIGS